MTGRLSGRVRWWRFAVLFGIAVLGVVVSTPAAQAGRGGLAKLLDLYASGRTDEALTVVARATRGQARDLRAQLVSSGHAWIHAGPADLSPRIFAAAVFALDMETLRAERGEWSGRSSAECAGRCVLEWACIVLRARDKRDDAERLWLLGSIALVGGVRDWSFLQSPLTPPTPRTIEAGHVLHARDRHPGESRFRLARAEAIASRYDFANELDLPQPGVRVRAFGGFAPGAFAPAALGPIEDRRRAQLNYAMHQFLALVDDPAVGHEARIRLAYLHFRSEEYEEARREAETAANATADANLRYLARFVAGQAAQALGDLTAAEAQYAAALAARPRAQSATFALAALQFLRGAAGPAYDLINPISAPRQRQDDDDPWRLFLYADFPRLPALLADLRARIPSKVGRTALPSERR
jgi:hypothetical protein